MTAGRQQRFEEIDSFLRKQGRADLFAYLELPPDASVLDAQEALYRRQQWAQAQQSNPKHKGEAVWIIRHIPALRGALFDERDAYLAHLERARASAAPRAPTEETEPIPTALLLDTITGDPLPPLPPDPPPAAPGAALPPTISPAPPGPSAGPPPPPGIRALSPRAEAEGPALEPSRFPESSSGSFLDLSGTTPDPGGPLLELEGPESRDVRVWWGPRTLTLHVRNVGAGELNARVHSDRAWLTASPERLDPSAARQAIHLRIDPRQMPHRSGECRVTIAAHRGGTRAVLLTARRPSLLLLGALLVFGALLGLGALAALLWPAPAASAPRAGYEDPATYAGDEVKK